MVLPPLWRTPTPEGAVDQPRTPPGRGIFPLSARLRYAPVVQALVRVFQEQPRGLRPTTMSMAWHTAAAFNGQDPSLLPRMGGTTGGCMRTSPELNIAANVGLDAVVAVLEPVKRAFPFVSYADLYLLAGNTAIEFMGGPVIRFRPGRRDYTAPEETDARCISDNGRMPLKHVNNDPFPHSRDTLPFLFQRFRELGISLDTHRAALFQIVALMGGGHGVGFMHPEVTGNNGSWTETPFVFNNEYFVNLERGLWGTHAAEAVEGTGALQYRGGPAGRDVVMLPIDLAVRADRRLVLIVRLFARSRVLFFKHFVDAWQQLQENGVDFDAAV